MDKSDYTFPTQAEIDAIIRDAHQMRAEAIASWVRSAWAWMRPRPISVTSDRVPAELSL